MPDAVIVDVVRTPIGALDGALSGWHPVDLAGTVLAALVERHGLDPAEVDEVIMGCTSQVGAQGFNLGRNAVLAAGFPEAVPATTIDRRDGSSHHATAYAAQAVMSGVHEVVIAAGVEVTSLVPMGATFGQGIGSPFGPTVERRYADAGGLLPAGAAADLVARERGLTRDDVDAFALRSQQRAAHARAEGRFGREVVAVRARHRDRANGTTVAADGMVREDECIRAGLTAEDLAGLRPTFDEAGVVTAGNSAPPADGAAAVLVTSEAAARRLGLTPRARFHTFAQIGDDPRRAFTGTVPATHRALERAGLSLDQIDVVEHDEPFASVVQAWIHELHADPDRVNVNGGAIALGHPLGAAGARTLASLVAELERSGGRWGLQATAESGGLANVTVVERLG